MKQKKPQADVCSGLSKNTQHSITYRVTETNPTVSSSGLQRDSLSRDSGSRDSLSQEISGGGRRYFSKVRDLEDAFANSAVCCCCSCGCGHVGNSKALSKRSVTRWRTTLSRPKSCRVGSACCEAKSKTVSSKLKPLSRP
jgi:hypothetical protein